MRVLGYIMLHYGADYLEYAIQSIEAECEEIIILYSYKPSHGTATTMDCPDSPIDLYRIVKRHPKCKFISVNNVFMEGDHRGQIWQYTKGYDILLNVDSDEVWEPSQLRDAINQASKIDNRFIGINGFKHFWRSFNHIADPDFFTPVRLFNLRSENRHSETISPKVNTTIYHFGYATKPNMMEYKMAIHGHHAEIKPGWYDLWRNWRPTQRKGLFHMASNTIWTDIIDFDKTTLPKILKEHPYYNLDIIE